MVWLFGVVVTSDVGLFFCLLDPECPPKEPLIVHLVVSPPL